MQSKGSQQELTEISDSIASKIKALPEYTGAKLLLSYNALPGEIGLTSLEGDKEIACPVCDTETEEMQFVLSNGELMRGAYGILEPTSGRVVRDFSDSLCLVPALAYDEKGNRLGRGKGYYDKFLSTYSGVIIGVSRDSLVLPEIPTEKNDVPVPIIVTEKRVIRLK